MYLKIKNPVVILLACIFFCLGGQSLALAADASTPLETPPESRGEGEPVDLQGEIETIQTPQVGLVVVGRVYFVAGEVQAINQTGEIRLLRKEDSIYVGDTITSTTGALAHIRMEDGGLIALRAESQLRFDKFKFRGKEDGTEYSSFTLSAGGFRALTGLIGRNNPQNYRIATPSATIGIIGGTDHEVTYLADNISGALAGTYSKVNSGGTTLSTDMGQVNVELNQMGYSGNLSQLPQLLPINSSLFIEVPDDGFIPGIDQDILTPPTPSAAGDSAATGQSAETPEGSRFVPAPILWGGNVVESFRKQKTGSGQSRMQHVQSANVRARTYVWQPWLAQVSGGLGFVNAKDATEINTDKYARLNNRGALSLIPYSRFPFFASYYINDRGTGAGAGGFFPASNFGDKSQGFVMRQKYRPQSNSSNSEASYDRNRIQAQPNNSSGDRVSSRLHLRHDYRLPRSPALLGVGYDRSTDHTDEKGPGTVTAMKGRYLTKFSKESVEVNALHSEKINVQAGSSFNNLTARHTYRPDRQLSVTTSGYANQSKLLNATQNSAGARYLQANSSATWQPDEELPFYVFGSVRVLDSVSDTLSSSTRTTQSQVANANVNYTATPNLRYAVRGALGNTRSDGRSSRNTLAGGSASYHADTIKLENASRNWHISGGLDYQTNTAFVSDLTVFGEVGQGIKLPYVSDVGPVDFNFSQLLSVRNSGNFGQTNTLTHNGRVTWRSILGESLVGGANFTVADIRRFGDDDSQAQTANLGVNVQQRTGHSSKTAMATLGWTANGLGQSTTRAQVDIRYDHARTFNVKGLRYNLTFTMTKSQLSQNTGTIRDGYAIKQKLEYGIGRAYLRLSGFVAKQDESTNSAIVFELGRSFGDG